MKKSALTLKLATALVVGFPFLGFSQSPYVYDAFTYSQQKIIGTARMQGIGGGYSALGGDASNAAINPAGLGFYNRSEVSVTPIFGNVETSTNYISSTQVLTNTKAGIGQAAVVFSNRGVGSRKKRSTFAVGFTRLSDFNREYAYSGDNNKSSISDAFAARAAAANKSAATLDEEFNTSTVRAASPEALYYQGFLIDAVSNGFQAVELSIPVRQMGKVQESGANNQWNLSYGVNFDDKTYVGASLGIQSLNYYSLRSHNESFPNATAITNFDYFTELTTRGSGVNLSVGAIVKPISSVQVGFNLTTPTAMSVTETSIEGVDVRFKPNTIKSNYPKIQTLPNDFEFRLTSPFRGNVGATVFLPSKLGFISTDVEYVGYRSMNLKDSENTQWSAQQQSDIQAIYKNAVNAKVGGELRFGNVRARAGVNYLGSPYQQASSVLSNSQMIYTLGAGYRTDRLFFDVAGRLNTFTDSYTPYTVANPADYASAAITNRRTNVAISIGAFF